MRQLTLKWRMGIFAIILIFLWTLGELYLPTRSPYRTLLTGLCLLLLAVPASYCVWKLFQSVRRRLLWKIKRRLVLANIFIGAIPILIMVAIFWFAGLLFYYQFSYYLITNQIKIHSSQIQAFNMSFRERLQEVADGSESPAAVLEETLNSDAGFLINSYPSATIILRFKDPATGQRVTYVNQARDTGREDLYRIPAWIEGRPFSGLVVEDMQPQIYNTRLLLRSFVGSPFMPDMPDFEFGPEGFPATDLDLSLEVSVPFDHHFLNRLKAALGQDILLVKKEIPSLNVVLQNITVREADVVNSTYEDDRVSLPERSGWLSPVFPVKWSNGEEEKSFDLGVLLVEPSSGKLIENIFQSEGSIGKRITGILVFIVGVFLVVECISIVIGIVLTKSITNAVYELDRGTEFVKRGDFGHRIIVKSGGQLGALAASFNQMTEYIQQLIRERVLKERMERELEIAKEVQEQLFPVQAPHMNHLDVSGTCLPARTVSGDYYDYVLLNRNELGLAVGDICGKGISAALLMANLQATLRSNALYFQQNGDNGQQKTVAEIVHSINRQMYGYTAANKFATLFYGVYKDAERTLTYCNAGHNPPLYFEGDEVRQLSAGGTVIGIFDDSLYDQETVQLNAGGILVAYTDGIVESVNKFGEEFGEARVIQLVQQCSSQDTEQIKNRIVESVLAWTSAEEREDDMTLIVAKIPDTIKGGQPVFD